MHQNTSQFTLAKTQPCRLTQFMEEELEEMALLTAEPAISFLSCFLTIFLLQEMRKGELNSF